MVTWNCFDFVRKLPERIVHLKFAVRIINNNERYFLLAVLDLSDGVLRNNQQRNFQSRHYLM